MLSVCDSSELCGLNMKRFVCVCVLEREKDRVVVCVCTDGYGDLENLIQEYNSRLVQLHHTMPVLEN